MKDWRGIQIKRGSLVVYPVREGSSMWVNEARVERVSKDEIAVRRTRTTEPGSRTVGERLSFPDPTRVTVIEETG